MQRAEGGKEQAEVTEEVGGTVERRVDFWEQCSGGPFQGEGTTLDQAIPHYSSPHCSSGLLMSLGTLSDKLDGGGGLSRTKRCSYPLAFRILLSGFCPEFSVFFLGVFELNLDLSLSGGP